MATTPDSCWLTTMQMIDTHAHLTDKSLLPNIEQYLDEAKAAGVVSVLAIGTTLESSPGCVELS